MTLPAVVAELTGRHLEMLDAALPGRVTGLYLTGSLPLGDFHPHTSDIDGVVVVTEPVTELDVLREIHGELTGGPAYDVVYLTAAELALPPRRDRPAVFTLDGEFKTAPHGGPVTPVLWAELARRPVVVREHPGLEVYDDDAALRAFTRDNLASYWVPQTGELERHLDGLPDDAPVETWVLTWFVLGVPRLHALLATGEFVSKSAAGHWAARHFPRWAELCDRCVAARAGAPQSFTVADARAAVALSRAVVADVLRAG
jgi:hypothetical protein